MGSMGTRNLGRYLGETSTPNLIFTSYRPYIFPYKMSYIHESEVLSSPLLQDPTQEPENLLTKT
jgi:hypothetical protein